MIDVQGCDKYLADECGAAAMQLKSMSIDRLADLRDKIDVALKAKIADARNDLEVRLKQLPGGSSSKQDGRRGPKGPVPPKYKNPNDPSETWTGRGLRPRWLAAELKRGVASRTFSLVQRHGTVGRRR
jgi:DNA-binding protein H-NS